MTFLLFYSQLFFQFHFFPFDLLEKFFIFLDSSILAFTTQQIKKTVKQNGKIVKLVGFFMCALYACILWALVKKSEKLLVNLDNEKQ